MGFSDTQGTSLLALIYLTQVFGQIIMGYLSDRYEHYSLMLGLATRPITSTKVLRNQLEWIT